MDSSLRRSLSAVCAYTMSLENCFRVGCNGSLVFIYQIFYVHKLFLLRFRRKGMYYNFQRRMSRLGQRWRAQRSVITIVNCRIPWINWDLNVYCAFGISPKACLPQCLIFTFPELHSPGMYLCASGCLLAHAHYLLALLQHLLSAVVRDWCVLLRSIAALWCGCTIWPFTWPVRTGMKLSQQTRWI